MDDNAPLQAGRFPQDWYYRYGERLKQEYVNFMWEDYPAFHRWRGIIGGEHHMGHHTRHTKSNIFEGEAPNNDHIGWAYHFYNTTATLYLAHGGDSTKHLAIQELSHPIQPEDWVRSVYDTWASTCERRERFDARFVFAPLHFSPQEEKRVRKWLGLASGDQPGFLHSRDLQRLIEWHIKHCDMLEATAARAVTHEEEEHVDSLGTSQGLAKLAKAHYSAITPTFRAVFAMGTNAMADTQHVLLVLTGHNEAMVSGPPTFDSIANEIVAWRSPGMVEVPLQTAVRYLRLLERREEAVNVAFRAKNDERREAMYRNLMSRAAWQLEDMRVYLKPRAGRRKRKRLELTTAIDVVMNAVWRDNIVPDEAFFAVLLSTRELRSQAMCENGAADGHNTLGKCRLM